MNETLTNLLERIIGGSAVSTKEVLWGGLIVGLLFASVHLVTMLVTRWGDHKASSKSLIFSILVHISCAVGLLVVNPPDPPAREPEPEKDEPFVLQSVSLSSDEPVATDEPGNTPIWKKVSAPVKIPVSRQEPRPLEFEPLESVRRDAEPVPRPELDEPRLPARPDEPIATPRPESQGNRGPLEIAKIPQRIDDPAAERRPEVETPSALDVRRPLDRPPQRDDPVSRNPNRGAVDRIEKSLDPPERLASIDEAPVDPRAFLNRGPADEAIRMRRGPAPAPVASESTGTAAEEPAEGSSGGAKTSPQLARIRTRPLVGREEASTDVHRPERTPSMPNPARDRGLAVRDGLRVAIPREGPEPNVLRPNFDAPRPRRTTSLPETYRLRRLARQKEVAEKFGATDESERAVNLGLRWLALHQHPDGYWDADAHEAGRQEFDENGVDRQFAGKHADTGVTALAVLAFLGRFHTHEEGEYSGNVSRALDWLVRNQRDDGFLGGEATHYERMYCHAMATFALAEALAMQSDPTLDTGLRDPLEKAVEYILETQNQDDGGWRYRPYFKGQKSDMSMFGWQLMALKSAKLAGISVPADAEKMMVRFLKSRSLGPNSGLAGYRPDMPATASMTAEALFSKQVFDIPRTHPASLEAVEYLLGRLPSRREYNLYYWYYGTLAMYQHGGEPWRKWDGVLRNLLIADQRQSGDAAGSWDPNCRWGAYGGRVYSTALSMLCLEVYYRYPSRSPSQGWFDD